MKGKRSIEELVELACQLSHHVASLGRDDSNTSFFWPRGLLGVPEGFMELAWSLTPMFRLGFAVIVDEEHLGVCRAPPDFHIILEVSFLEVPGPF